MKRNYCAKNIFLKRTMALLLTGMFFWMTQWTPVKADLIWEPYEDDFYSKNYQDCKHVGADYITNGEAGYVTVYKAPDSSKEVAKFMNGKRFFVSFSWEDKGGNVWGVIEMNPRGIEEGEYIRDGITLGWVCMTDMAKVYSSGDFKQEHQDEFGEYQGELDEYVIEEGIVLWDYPGGKSSPNKLLSYLNDEPPMYDYLYTDPDGNRWTYIGYYYGYRNVWVCIDAPEEEQIEIHYEKEETEEELHPAKAPEEGLSNGSGVPGLKLAAGLVAIVVGGTAGLIGFLFGKRKQNN